MFGNRLQQHAERNFAEESRAANQNILRPVENFSR